MLRGEIGEVGWDSVCQSKAFELYSVRNGELLKVYKHGSNMIRFMFCKDDWKNKQRRKRLNTLIFTLQIFIEYLQSSKHLLGAEDIALS